ncbi:MAG: 2-oxoacid:acceptor oxidoreductase family protein [Pseudomonadota bacterium]
MDRFSIYLTGVGGQGIGLLSEIILRAADHAGHGVKGVDTHGLAQRGGIVVSCIRIGEKIHTPLIPAGKADLVIALECHEALRGLNEALGDGGALVWYDTAWQPLEVRMGAADPVGREKIAEACKGRNIREIAVSKPDLSDSRMQNIVLLAALARAGLIPEIEIEDYARAMEDLMSGEMLRENMALFRAEAAG